MALPRKVPQFAQMQVAGKPLPTEVVDALTQTSNNTFDLRDYLLNLFVDDETPSGTQDGINKSFNLNFVPMPPNSLRLYKNGALLAFGIDYILTGSSLSLAGAPVSADIVLAYYRRSATAPAVASAASVSSASGAITPPASNPVLNVSSLIIDNETPSGTINGSNTGFTLANSPNPATSLQLYANGVEQVLTTDYTLSGASITFTTAPATGDLLRAYYRYAPGSANYLFYFDNETPLGLQNGSNVTFTLANVPNPSASLRLYLNGIEQIPATDYTLSSDTITFTTAPATVDQMVAFYRALVLTVTSFSLANFADNETPSGTINGSNKIFTLANAPNPAACLELLANGVRQLLNTDFTLAANTITFTTAPATGDLLRAYYRF